ncbi:MAG: putative polysaccharide biosynthesis protein [Bacillota bacterium]
MSRKESLVRGAVALALAGLIIKLSNLLVRLPLTRLIGSEGLGIYQMALPAFNALLHLAAGGVPVAVQNLVAEYTERRRRAVADRVLRLALLYALLAGGAATCLLLAGAPLLARLLGDPRAYQPLVAVAPAVLLFALDAIYRNYLQGRKVITPSAAASILEQGTKVLVTLGAAWLLLPLGREYAAAGAALGITGGAVVSLGYMIWAVRRIRTEDREEPEPAALPTGLGRRMLQLAWPVTVGSITLPLLNVVDVGIVQQGFRKAGYTLAEATSLYGAYSGIAVQVVWFPFVLTNALANATVPTLTAAQARGDRAAVRERVLMGLRAASLICLPVAMGAMILAAPIVRLFGEPLATEPLRYMGPVALLGPLTWMTVAQLQALGETAAPMRNLGLAMAVKLVLDALLAPIRGVDVLGVAAASVVMFLLCVWLNGRTLARLLGEPLPWGRLLMGPLVASLVMGAGVAGLLAATGGSFGQWEALLAALATAPFLYVGALIATRSLTRSELLGLAGPLAPRLERWLMVIWPWS